jgi:hypothetical protein
MKYLAITAAVLFLAAAPLSALAQSDNGSGAGGSNSGGNTERGDVTGSTSTPRNDAERQSDKSECSDETATSGAASQSFKCRSQEPKADAGSN